MLALGTCCSGYSREGKGTGVQVLVSLGVDSSQLRQNALQLLAVEEPLPPGETVTGAYDLSDMSFFGTVPVGQRQGVPWWRPFLARDTCDDGDVSNFSLKQEDA